MAARIEIKNIEKLKNSESISLLKMIREDTEIILDDLEIVQIYHINEKFSSDILKKLINELFCDPVYQEGHFGFHYAHQLDFDFGVEVSYKPGVTDNVGRTAADGIELILNRKIKANHVRSAKLYLFKGKKSIDDQNKIANQVLCNNLIEEYRIFTPESIEDISYQFKDEIEFKPPFYQLIDLEVEDQKLIEISNKGLLSLNLNEMKAIRDYYRGPEIRQLRGEKGLPICPTDVELEVFAQTWSEHCKHKIFSAKINFHDQGQSKEIKSLFKTYIQKSAFLIKKNRKDLLSLFIDNAGVVQFNQKYAYCVKVETHNSPSALDPYGGAMTGIVGVNRDILGTGLGAYPIFNTDIFCFGDPFIPKESVPSGLLYPKRVFRGVHRGIKDGGNESGIPTVNGSISFDSSFIGKPLVFCGTGGFMPLNIKGRKSYEKYCQVGDLIVMSGGKIGKDGIHGATFSSAHLSETSPTSAVQIGDPITQKKMVDFLIEARDRGLYNAITDNGAGGLSSSVGEMSELTNGALVHLEKCPLKYSGLKPWEILVSEAQERMTIAVSPDKIEEFLALSLKRNVESTVIGEFTDSGFFDVRYKNEIVCLIDLKMLHMGLPELILDAIWVEKKENRLQSTIDDDFTDILKKLLARPNIASKEYWVRMYDHEIGARTVGKPFMGKENDGPSDGAVLKLFPDSNEGLVITHGIVPRYSKFNTYHMAANAIDEAVRSALVLGANPEHLVGLDNFCWPDPEYSAITTDGKYKLAQLVKACEAIFDLTIKYNCPCISGKDSMKNDYRQDGKKISVLPTLLFTVTGKIDDISRMQSFYFKQEDCLIYLIGQTRPELGASEYYEMKQITEGTVPKVFPDQALKIYHRFYQLIQDQILLSAHDLSDGGLSVALSECAFSGKVGIEVCLDDMEPGLTSEEKLFSETPSRILVSLKKENEKKFLEIIGKDNCSYLGKTNSSQQIMIKNQGITILNADLDDLKTIWKNALIF